LVSFRALTRPVKPVQMDNAQESYFNKAVSLWRSKRFPEAAETFIALSRLFPPTSAQSRASSYAMISNSYKMRANRYKGNPSIVASYLGKALKYLDLALKVEPYWAEYLTSRGRLKLFIHEQNGCEAKFNGNVWQTDCYKVCRALGLPGISPGMTVRFECSICGKDPVICEHIPGKTYDGKVALMVAKDIQIDEVSIVDEPMQKETYVLPYPLTVETLKKILPRKIAKAVITGKRPLTCKDLLKAIRKNNLRGINWQPVK